MHEKFLDNLEVIKDLGIHVNGSCTETLHRKLMMYQSDRENPEFPIWLIVRELGGIKKDYEKNTEERLSNHAGTIVLQQYFGNYQHGLSHIFSELNRISGGNVASKVINETSYQNDGDEVTIDYEVNGISYSSKHMDEYQDGTLMFDFVKTELIPNFKGSVTNGQIVYWGDEYFTFLFLTDISKIQQLRELMKFETF